MRPALSPWAATSAWLLTAALAAAAPGCLGKSGAPEDTSPGTSANPPDGGAGEGPTLSASELAALALLAPATLPGPPPDVTNAHADDPKAAAFGQKLFFDPGFSGPLLGDANDGVPGTLGTKGQTGKVACVSCHDPARGFVDDRSPDEQISLGAAWGRRRARSLLDVGQGKLFGWDGRHDTLYNATIGALEEPVDVNTSRLYVAEQIIARYGTEYQAIFGTFPGVLADLPPLTAAESGCLTSVTFTPEPTCDTLPRGVPGDGAEYDSLSYDQQNAVTEVAVNVGKAIGAYERLLTCGPSRFDAWIHGQKDALNASEQRGAQVFAQLCVECHSGPYLSDNAPHNVGLRPTAVSPVAFVDQGDQGAAVGILQAIGDPLNSAGKFSDGDDHRLPSSVAPSLSGAFYTPRLRCVSDRPSLSHTGQLASLTAMVQHFNAGGDTSGFPGTSEIGPLGLSDSSVVDVAAFLASLQGPGPEASLLVSPQ
jgi:cytochrome c peroxidase